MTSFQHFDKEENLFEYFSDDLHVANVVLGLRYTPDANVKVTSGNGWCDKGVYHSWNKCNINGECFPSCNDGLCYEAHKSGETKIVVPNQCDKWYRQCAEDCNSDSNCVAFSFLDTNVLGHAEYTCHLMSELTCNYANQNQGDPRSSFHVKGDYLDSLLDKYNVNTKAQLDAKLASDIDFVFGHWSSWGYHSCKRPDGRTCGDGTQTRKRTNNQGQLEKETRDCDFRDDDGNLLICPEIIEEEEVIAQHGWMSWGTWTACTKSCESNGIKQRSRNCAVHTDLSVANEAHFVAPGGDYEENCPVEGALEQVACDLGKCLPFTNGSGFKLKKGWNLNPNRQVVNTDKNWHGRCKDYQNSYKKVNIEMANNNNAFNECMRVCQEVEKNDCLGVSFFPSANKGASANRGVNFFYGTDDDGNQLFNCFLHNERCHETPADFVDTFWNNPTSQDNHKAWYAYKDLCSGSKVCDSWGNYMKTICVSHGSHGFPNEPLCSCPGTSDKYSELRIFGNSVGFEFFDFSRGAFNMRRRNDSVTQRSPFYSEGKYGRNWDRVTGGMSYQDVYGENILACHG